MYILKIRLARFPTGEGAGETTDCEDLRLVREIERVSVEAVEKEEGGGAGRGRDTIGEGENEGRGGAAARGLSYDQPSPLTLVLLLLRLRVLRTLRARIEGGGDAGGEGHCSGSVISKYDSFLLWTGGEYE